MHNAKDAGDASPEVRQEGLDVCVGSENGEAYQ